MFYFGPEKYTFFYALKDAIDHLLGKIFYATAISKEL